MFRFFSCPNNPKNRRVEEDVREREKDLEEAGANVSLEPIRRQNPPEHEVVFDNIRVESIEANPRAHINRHR